MYHGYVEAYLECVRKFVVLQEEDDLECVQIETHVTVICLLVSKQLLIVGILQKQVLTVWSISPTQHTGQKPTTPAPIAATVSFPTSPPSRVKLPSSGSQALLQFVNVRIILYIVLLSIKCGCLAIPINPIDNGCTGEIEIPDFMSLEIA